MRNHLFLNRLIIYTLDGKVAYDEEYHRGVNIIRGENSSGKSTITHFIFYVLGGAFNDWVKEAKKCSEVIAEVELNGAKVTLKRPLIISDKTKKTNASEALFFFWGSIDNALKTSSEWSKYNFNSTTERISFSNVLFENLDLPIVKGENNITFHQILRLLYIDQNSPTSSLFYYEQFDSSFTRETVSDLLLGVYDQELYDKQQRKEAASKELEDIKSEIKTLRKYVNNPLDLSPSNIQSKIEKKEIEITKLDDNIIKLRNEKKIVKYSAKTELEFEVLNKQTISQRKIVSNLDQKIKALKFEIADTNFFIEALENKINALKKSVSTRQLLGEFPLEYCPECLSEIEPNDSANTCKLCKKEIDESFGVSQARKIEQELSFQIKESRNLVSKRERELLNIESNYESEKIKYTQLQKRFNQSMNDVRTIREERLDLLYVDKGFIEGEIMQLRTLFERAEIYQGLKKKELALVNEVDNLKLIINSLRSKQEKLKKAINRQIEKKGVYLLNNDFKRQKEFFEAKEFHIDYHNNIAFISDKEAKYSASSSFYLKVSARYSIFLASLENEKMRFPRFIFCDNMEDKGIEEPRAQNFQKILIEETKKYKKENFQLIYTTSFIPDELNNNEYCVGEYYTEQNPSLKHV